MELRNRTFVLIDAETTGYDEKKHQILEVAMLVIRNMEVIGELNLPVKHKEYNITAGAMAANKIDLVKHEETALSDVEAAGKILSFLKEHKDIERFITIGQNIDFDLKFLEEMFLKAWKIKEYRELIGYRKLDIMQVALLKSIEGKITLEKQDLDAILKALDIEIPVDRHRALADCYLEFEALKKLLSL